MAQGQVVAVDVQGDACRGEGASDRGDGPGAGAYQDGHVAPGDAVLQMCPTEDVGDVVQFRAGCRVRVHLDPAAVPYRGQLAVGTHLLRREPGQGHALGEQAGSGQQGGGGAAGGPEHLYGGRNAVRAREGAREFQDAVHVGAPERVDRLVGVAEGDEVAAAAGEGVQQSYLGRVGVLVLVHEHGVVLRG